MAQRILLSQNKTFQQNGKNDNPVGLVKNHFFTACCAKLKVWHYGVDRKEIVKW